jgi:hypothetical protein
LPVAASIHALVAAREAPYCNGTTLHYHSLVIAAAHFADQIRWNEPGTWPFFIYIWLIFLVCGPALSAWRWLRREQSKSWPSTAGRIDLANIAEPKRFLGYTLQLQRNRPYVAVLSYSYSLSGDRYRGTYKRELGSEEEALDFLRGLKAQPVTVHYHPAKPSDSVLLESSVESLLAARPPLPPNSALFARRALPSWLQPFLGLLAAGSLLGLLVSLWVHIGALLGRNVAPEWLFFTLHLGIFVVWLPAVLVLQKRIGYTGGRDVWKKAFQGAPDGLRFMVYFFFAYAGFNFLLFWLQAPAKSVPFGSAEPVPWRGFSGHWMAFYSAALAVFLSALHSKRDHPD